jgi:glycosyltransferase involved in cell wall biosynthesis
MTDHVVLAGPASPPALSGWLNAEDARRARELPALGGTALANIAGAFLSTGRYVELVTLAPELKGETVVLEGPRLRLLIAPFRPRARHRCPDAFRQERRHVRALLMRTSGRVVNAHWTYEFALGAAGLPHRATVVTAHDAPLTVLRSQRPRTYRAVRLAMAAAVRLRSPAMTAVSPYLAAAWRKQMFYRGHMSVVPNVIPLVVTTRAVQEDLRTPRILDVAAAGKLKNVAALIRAMPQILISFPGAKLRLVGHGLTEESTLAGLAQRLNVAEHIEFFGRVAASELDSVYRDADLFVHASLEESCPMSIGEAMSHGLPVVAGRQSGGVPWLLDEGRSGLLVDVRSPAAIANGVIQLLASGDVRRSLAAAGLERVRSRLSPEAVTDGYLEVYARAEAAA